MDEWQSPQPAHSTSGRKAHVLALGAMDYLATRFAGAPPRNDC